VGEHLLVQGGLDARGDAGDVFVGKGDVLALPVAVGVVVQVVQVEVF